MPRGLNLDDLRKGETKSITLAIPIEQFTILEQLAEATHRAMNDVVAEVFVTQTVPKIKKMLDNKDVVKNRRIPKQPAPATLTNIPSAALVSTPGKTIPQESDRVEAVPPQQLLSSRPSAAPVNLSPIPSLPNASPSAGPAQSQHPPTTPLTRPPAPRPETPGLGTEPTMKSPDMK